MVNSKGNGSPDPQPVKIVTSSKNSHGQALVICKQEGQRCPKRWVAQAAIRLPTAVITFRNKERNVRSPS